MNSAKKNVQSKLNFRSKNFLIISCSIFLVLFIAGITAYQKTKSFMKEQEEKKINVFSQTLSLLVKSDIQTKIDLIQDSNNIVYLDFQNKLDLLKTIYPEVNSIFAITPSKDNLEEWRYLLSVANNLEEKFNLKDKFVKYKIPIAKDKFEIWYNEFEKTNKSIKYIPIFNSNNKIEAIFGYSISFEHMQKVEKNIYSFFYVYIFISLFISIFLSYYIISSQINALIQKFNTVINNIINKDYSVVSYNGLSNEFNEIISSLNTITDNFKNKEVEISKLAVELKEDKSKFKFILNSMSEGLFTVDKNRKIIEFNKGAEKITGFTREEAIGKNCKQIFHRDFCEVDCAILNVVKTGEAIINKESNIITKSNMVLPILSSSSPLLDEYGNIIGCVETFRDISDFKKVNEQLESAKNQAEVYNSILKEQNKELLETYTNLENMQHKTNEYLKQLESTNYILDKKIVELSKLNEFSMCLSSILDFDELLYIVTKASVEQMDADSGSLMLLDETQKELSVRVAFGNYYHDILNTHVRVGDGISGWVAKTGEALLVTNIEKDPRFKHLLRSNYESKSLISVPLKSKDKVIGVLNINHKKTKDSFNKDDLDFLITIINQSAVAIENANLYEKLERSYFETVHALTMAVEAKDSCTRGHSDRVIKYALELAKAIGFSEKQLERVRYAGALHDIGKIGISELIINKDQYLTQEEYAIIKKHPVIGASIIEPIEFLAPIRSIIRHHHEHYDGNGYPDGLSGENIIYEARILAVADSYDAMTSDRPYRRALGDREALIELKKYSGTQFDPKLVAIFEDVLLRRKNEKTMLD